MTDHPFVAEVAALQALISEGPGAYPESAEKARRLLEGIDRDRRTNNYVSEKVGVAKSSFAQWFSARRWNQGGDGGARVRQNLFEDVSKLDNALRSVHRQAQQVAE